MRLDALHFTRPLEESDFALFLEWVSLERRARISRYRSWQDAHRSLYGELLARAVIQQKLNLALGAISFKSDVHGKPFLPGVPNFHFNLSHSGHWILFASGEFPVGVDVEQIQALQPELLAEVLTAEEKSAFTACRNEDRAAFFYTIWTVKESYAKVLGLGLQLTFLDLNVRTGSSGGLQILYRGRLVKDIAIWTYMLDQNHPAALCTRRGQPPLMMTIWDSEQLMNHFKGVGG